MLPDQIVGVAVNSAIYLALVVFILYRQMSARVLRASRLMLLPGALGLFGLQQLARQSLAIDVGGAALLGVGLVIGMVAGLWRGTTFRLWCVAGRVMVKGTALTLLTWAVLIAIRLPFAFLGHVANHPQGFVIGELLLSLAITFAAQNGVIWVRAKRLNVVQPAVRRAGHER